MIGFWLASICRPLRAASKLFLAQRFQKVPQFFVHLGAIAHRPGDFALDHVAEMAAETVDGDLHRAFGQAELVGRVGLREVFRIAGEPRFEG